MLVAHLKRESILNLLQYICLWTILLSSLISCRPSKISIEQISPKQVGKTVFLTGKVVHLAPFVYDSAYQIEDQTGRAWVISTKQPPKLGQTISIKGKIQYQSLPFAEQELGDFYLIELEQLDEKDHSLLLDYKVTLTEIF